MGSKDEDAIQRNGRPEARRYNAPRLVEYGAILELTAAGSGDEGEKGGSSGNPFKRP